MNNLSIAANPNGSLWAVAGRIIEASEQWEKAEMHSGEPGVNEVPGATGERENPS